MTPNPRALPDAIGPYEIIGPLGRGGNATVFRGRHKVTGIDAAVKLLAPRKNLGEAEERFRREFRAMSALDHPAVVQVHDSGTSDGRLWYAMDLLDGVTLDAWWKAQPNSILPIRASLELMLQAADGLGAAHEAGLVHRDIKPRNLMLTEEMKRLTIVDFGLAKQTGSGSSLTADGKIVGTPVWLAPERLTSNAVASPTWDVYSLGLTFYRAVSGQNPFRGSSLTQTLTRIQRGTVPAPSVYRLDLPLSVDKLLLATLSGRPEKRPADGGVLAARLRATLAELPPEMP